jgi:hypothetical protein
VLSQQPAQPSASSQLSQQVRVRDHTQDTGQKTKNTSYWLITGSGSGLSRYCFAYIGPPNGPVQRPKPARYFGAGMSNASTMKQLRGTNHGNWPVCRVRPARGAAARLARAWNLVNLLVLPQYRTLSGANQKPCCTSTSSWRGACLSVKLLVLDRCHTNVTPTTSLK